uniref:Spermatosis associated 1 n=1 Tax=Aotus nancymaae TaxID=37293 RepID=A0A2K5DKL8_AOTNA
MKKDKKKIPIDNYPIQTLVNMSLNPSRPSSSELVELHVFYVPEGSWNYKLNTILTEVVNRFISAGFLRVSPQLTLQALRERLGEFLGEDAIAEKFLFLKCIGNNLAVVKEKQESELKLRSFTPPYAVQPELYLLPIMDHLGNVYSPSSTVILVERQTNNGITEVDGTIHRPVSVSLFKEEPGRDPSLLENTLKELPNKNQEEAGGKATAEQSQIAKNQIGNSALPRSLEDSDNDYFDTKKSQCLWKNEDDTAISRTRDNQIGEKEYITLPDHPLLPCQPILPSGITAISLLHTEREKVIKQMKQLFEQMKLKRYHAYVGWKKKYLETKKVTASMEENYLIIQITEVQHAIDQLKRKLDIDKMKLIIEVKRRKQAVSDLRTLKTELAQ